MSLINSKVEPKLRWTNHCVLSMLVANADNHDGANSNNFYYKIHKTICFCCLM